MVEKLAVLCCPHPAAYQDPKRFDSAQMRRWGVEATGCAGCWLLAAGCWLLAAGCWLPATVALEEPPAALLPHV